jgi:hypothetical protein
MIELMRFNQFFDADARFRTPHRENRKEARMPRDAGICRCDSKTSAFASGQVERI